MNKLDLINAASRVLSTREEARVTVEKIFDAMRTAFRSGERVVIHGFGSFHPVTRKAKKARNIHTKESVMVPAHRWIKFKPAKELFGQFKDPKNLN